MGPRGRQWNTDESAAVGPMTIGHRDHGGGNTREEMGGGRQITQVKGIGGRKGIKRVHPV